MWQISDIDASLWRVSSVMSYCFMTVTFLFVKVRQRRGSTCSAAGIKVTFDICCLSTPRERWVYLLHCYQCSLKSAHHCDTAWHVTLAAGACILFNAFEHFADGVWLCLWSRTRILCWRPCASSHHWSYGLQPKFRNFHFSTAKVNVGQCPLVWHWALIHCPQPDTSRSCKITDTGPVCHVVCLFTSQLLAVPIYTAW